MRDVQPPTPTTDSGRPDRPDHFNYFMVRVRWSARDPESGFSAVIERLGTGEKRQVESSEQLAQVVKEWSR